MASRSPATRNTVQRLHLAKHESRGHGGLRLPRGRGRRPTSGWRSASAMCGSRDGIVAGRPARSAALTYGSRVRTDMSLLSDRTAVITGGARGIGLAIAQTFTEHGARVVLGDLDDVALDKAVAVLGG